MEDNNLLKEIQDDYANAKKKSKTSKKKKENKRFKAIRTIGKVVSSSAFIYVVLVCMILSALAYLFVSVATFFKYNEAVFQNPFPWSFETRTPVYFIEREIERIYVPVVTGEMEGEGTRASSLTEEEKVAMIMELSEYPKQLLKIRMLESTNGSKDIEGLHIFCESVGMTNEFGYDPFATTGNRCFATYEESIQAVDNLLEDLLSRFSLNEALCIYNTGKSAECVYLAHYKSL